MIKAYFGAKFICEFVIPVGIFTIIFVILVINAYRDSRKEKLLQKYGYEKYLRGVSSVGNGEFYGWRKNFHNMTDLEVRKMTYRELKTIILNAERDDMSNDAN